MATTNAGARPDRMGRAGASGIDVRRSVMVMWNMGFLAAAASPPSGLCTVLVLAREQSS
jgi:hypothetical protein